MNPAAAKSVRPADEIETCQPYAELGVCARTTAVRDAIVTLIERVHSCADGDKDDLTAVKIKQLVLRERGITALHPGDFAGLARLRELRLNGNALRSLPGGFFEGPAALRLVHPT